MSRSLTIGTLSLLCLGLAGLPSPGQNGQGGTTPPAGDDKITITTKVTLQQMWVYEIGVTSNTPVDLTLWAPPKVTKSPDGSSLLQGGAPTRGTRSFQAQFQDGTPVITSYSSGVRRFVDMNEGGEWSVTLVFDRKTDKGEPFSGEYSLNIKAQVTR